MSRPHWKIPRVNFCRWHMWLWHWHVFNFVLITVIGQQLVNITCTVTDSAVSLQRTKTTDRFGTGWNDRLQFPLLASRSLEKIFLTSPTRHTYTHTHAQSASLSLENKHHHQHKLPCAQSTCHLSNSRLTEYTSWLAFHSCLKQH